ncbi:MAG: DUF401 family protein [Desulfobacterales bacterium]
MEMLNAVPALLRVGLVFGFLLFAIRKKLSLGSAFALASILLGLLFGMRIATLIGAILAALAQPKTLALAVVVGLILVLSRSMESCGQMQRLLGRFEGLVRHPGINLITFPVLIGLLPMPGGAVFSAPMVQAIGEPRGHDPAELSYVNYWFRHIWEYWWPLYPGILLGTALAGVNLWLFVAVSFPMTLVALAGGFLSLSRRSEMQPVASIAPRPPLTPFLKELLPVLIVVLAGLGLGAALTHVLGSTASAVDKEAGLIIALIIAIGWVWHVNGLSGQRRREILLHPEQLGIAYMVAGILVFKGILEASGAVDALSRELLAWHIPLLPVTLLLPFLVGGVAGITIAFVGTTFPILIPLIQVAGQGEFLVLYLMLALVSGFTGVLLSPLHLCMLLSNSYFKASSSDVYKLLWLPCGVLISSGCIYFLALKWIIRQLS